MQLPVAKLYVGPVTGGPFGPYRQSERTSIYQDHIQSLLRSNDAYRCFCSSERLDQLNRRRHEKGLNLGYDRKCTHIPHEEAAEKAQKGEPHVIRFRAPDQWPRYEDLVYGKTGHGAGKTKKLVIDELVWEDAILLKSDGYPTYHWANVCDDHEMKITHVIRGSEWMSSTPLHVALYQAVGWLPPLYSHVPLLVDQNRQKLSKRNFDSDIASFRKAGIFPEALTNFAALLGWSHQQKTDVMNLKELEQIFDLKITKGNTIVSFDKLRYLQEHHARRRVIAKDEGFEQMIRDVAVAMLDKYNARTVTSFIGKRKLRDVIASMLQAESLPYRSAEDFADLVSLFLRPLEGQPSLELGDTAMLKDIKIAASTLCLVPDEQWTKEVQRSNLLSLQMRRSMDAGKVLAEEKMWKKELYHYLRWALLGGAAGPSIPETMEILGRPTCVQRIQKAALESTNLETVSSRPSIGASPKAMA
jgi:glutamyl-tRNA synthetase